jgi:two-component system, sensor histidine kinase PdtaS
MAMKKQLLLLITILHILNQFLYARENPRLSIGDAINKAVDMSFQNKDSALYFANYALDLAQKKDSIRLVFCAYRAIGLVNEDNNDLIAARDAYAAALSLADNRLTIEEQLTIYTDWAILHRKLAKYDIARDYHFKTVQKAEAASNWVMVEDGYNGLGVLYSMVGDFEQSVHYYEKSIKTAEKLGNQEGIVTTKHNISNVYFKAKKYDLALNHIEKTYQDALKFGDSLLIGSVLTVYGNIKLAVGDPQDALKKQEMAQHFFEQKGEKPCMAESFLAIGNIYFQLNNYPQAELYFNKCHHFSNYLPNHIHAEFYHKYGKFHLALHKPALAIANFNKSLELATKYKFKDIARQNLKALANFYAENQKYDLAYQYSKKADDLGETYFNENKNKGLAEAQFRFDIEKRDLEIKNQKKTLTLSKWAYCVTGTLCLALLVLLYFTWKQVKAKQIATKNAELLLKELHHRVKNNMQTIASMMRLQARQSQDPAVTSVLTDNKLRLEAFALLHQQLYKSDFNIETLDLQAFIENMIEKLRFSHGITECQFKTHVNIQNRTLNIETALSVGLILNELLTNSIKYAYPSLEKKQPLEVTINLLDDQLEYNDNGKILKPDFDFNKKAGFGIKFIASFVKQVRGKYRFYVDKGVHFNMSFPTP